MIDLCIHRNQRFRAEEKVDTVSIPESWTELTAKQFPAACACRLRMMLRLTTPDGLVRRALGIPKRVWRRIPPAQRQWIAFERLAFLTETKPVFRDNKMPVIRAGWRRLYGYENMMANVTWEEFIYADTLMLKDRHREALAVLYRPRRWWPLRPDDPRVPFSIYRLDRNTERMERLDEETLFALVTNYQAVRTASVVKKYRYLFPDDVATYEDGKKIEEDPQDDSGKKPQQSWADIHHTLMGDQAYEEEKFLHSKATTMLNWLNRRIKENREMERMKRK